MDMLIQQINGLPVWSRYSIALALLLLTALIANFIAKRIILSLVHNLAKKSKSKYDDIFVEHKVFSRLSHLAPALVVYLLAPIFFDPESTICIYVMRFARTYMIVAILYALNGLIDALHSIFKTTRMAKDMYIRTYVQVVKLIVNFIGAIFIISTALDSQPWGILTGLGALTAVLMLVFKDTILGFVASIQLTAHDMVKIGDWIEMSQYGADGDVLDITLNTVKVQNFDKTITTIPTYALISTSFRNWRGMQESGGRRIKRSINIDLQTIRFLDQAAIDKYEKIKYISEYMDCKRREIDEHNRNNACEENDHINRRRLTNVGTFRAYVIQYLRNHPKLHKEGMTFLVRQLDPTEHGLPLQIYVFTSDTNWIAYEGIQADIFDHLLAMAQEFDLRVYQSPSSGDLRALGEGLKALSETSTPNRAN